MQGQTHHSEERRIIKEAAINQLFESSVTLRCPIFFEDNGELITLGGVRRVIIWRHLNEKSYHLNRFSFELARARFSDPSFTAPGFAFIDAPLTQLPRGLLLSAALPCAYRRIRTKWFPVDGSISNNPSSTTVRGVVSSLLFMRESVKTRMFR